MSNEPIVQDERDKDLETLESADLKAAAKFFNIKAQRDWKDEDYIKAIVEARKEARQVLGEQHLPKVSGNTVDGAPKPGFARIIIHRDPTPGHANSPVQLGLNGHFFHVPRGIPVDVPLPYIGVLKDATQLVVRQKKEPSANNPTGEIVEEEIPSYPFQVVSITPGGKFKSNIDQRSNVAHRKELFVKAHGRWPTKGELNKFEEMQLQQATLTAANAVIAVQAATK